VLKKVTITLSEGVANWAREKAAKEHTPLSRLVERIIEKEMHESYDFEEAYQRWEKNEAMKMAIAKRLAR
jgi:hypothetical protein